MPNDPHATASPQPTVLIVAADALSAALLGALIELLGYTVRFQRPPESVHEAFRRTRPRIYLCDATVPALYATDVLGRAAMRGVSVVIYGSREVLDRVSAVAREHRIDTLLLPLVDDSLSRTLERALAG